MNKQDFEKAQMLNSSINEIDNFKEIFGNAKYFKIETSETSKSESFSFDINRFAKIEKYKNGENPSQEHQMRNKCYDIIRKAVFDYLNEIKELKEKEFKEI